MPTAVTIRAHAKVNLSLEVLAKRSDGYHEIRSVLQMVSLYDELTLYRGDSDSNDHHAPNFALIDRAIACVQERVGSNEKIAYAIDKQIPIAAGLGGGSSDAAAAMRAASKLLGTVLTQQDEQEIAESLGSDVPFFLVGGTAAVAGRGERVGPVVAPTAWLVLVGLGEPVSTASVFAELRSDEYGSGTQTAGTINNLAAGRLALGSNDLTAPAIRLFPEIRNHIELVCSACGHSNVRLSGSGGTVFALCGSEESAVEAHEQLAALVPWCRVVHSIESRR